MLEIHKDCLFFTLFRYFWELKLKGGGGGSGGAGDVEKENIKYSIFYYQPLGFI